MNLQNMKKNREGGFTLLELLIVISIIAILSVALIFVINPAETLRKSRDAQRISDLSTLKTAIALYLTSTTTPYMGTGNSNTGCKATPTDAWTAGKKIFYSISSATAITASSTDGWTGNITVGQVSTASLTLTDGTGWIPVNFDSLTGGSPISNLPIDPTNTVTVGGANSGDYVYRYACSITPLAFEIDASLESIAYASSSQATDGGNNASYFEVGTNLKIIGSGTTF
ncbi:MAG: type II secretion system protein [Candidatus Yonathbacteria bacterium]|nr:type II secretion system protein [Candidatus Yonathbacteria bacterium]